MQILVDTIILDSDDSSELLLLICAGHYAVAHLAGFRDFLRRSAGGGDLGKRRTAKEITPDEMIKAVTHFEPASEQLIAARIRRA